MHKAFLVNAGEDFFPPTILECPSFPGLKFFLLWEYFFPFLRSDAPFWRLFLLSDIFPEMFVFTFDLIL